MQRTSVYLSSFNVLKTVFKHLYNLIIFILHFLTITTFSHVCDFNAVFKIIQ